MFGVDEKKGFPFAHCIVMAPGGSHGASEQAMRPAIGLEFGRYQFDAFAREIPFPTFKQVTNQLNMEDVVAELVKHGTGIANKKVIKINQLVC